MKFKNLLHGLDPSGDYLYESDGVVVHCPAHADSQQSLKVTVTDEAKALFACRAGCSYDAIVDASAIERPDTFNVEEADTVVPAGRPPVVEAASAPVARLTAYVAEARSWLGRPEADAAVEYLKDRFGVTLELAVDLGIGFDPGGTAIDFDLRGKGWAEVPRVVIPFRSASGFIHGAQARAVVPAPRMRWAGLANPEGHAWGRYAIFSTGAGLDRVIITEGPGDALTAVAHGYDAIALPGAAVAKSPEVQDAVAAALVGKSVFIAGDADRAGLDFTEALLDGLDARGIPTYRLVLPDGVGDLADWFAADPDAFQAALDAAVNGAAPFISNASAGASGGPQHPLNDIGNALRLIDAVGDDILYSPEAGWFRWTGTHWQHDTLDVIRTQAQELLLRLLAAAPVTNPPSAEFLHFKRSGTSTRIDAMLKEAAAMRAVDIEDFDRDPDLLSFVNGTVNLRTGELRSHRREDRITRRLAVEYDPAATCPRWLRFLDEVFALNPDLPPFIQRLVGYGLTGHTSEQAFAVLHGTGANGKSVFIDTIHHVFDPIAETTPFSTFEVKPSGGIPNDLAALKGARLVFASEGERGVKMAEAVLKRVTGQDLITARFMRKEFFSFEPTFLILMATNHKPSFSGQDEGLWRRVKLIPWERYFAPDERDHYLAARLRDEAVGIAAWAVAGAVEWYQGGLADPPSVIDATSNYRSTSDALDGLIPDVLAPDRSARIDAPTAYKAYLAWAEREELALRETWSRRAFYQAMDERGYARKKSHGQTFIIGLKLHEDAPELTTPTATPSDDDRTTIFGEPA